jgi:hypothetical protein
MVVFTDVSAGVFFPAFQKEDDVIFSKDSKEPVISTFR